MNAKIELLSLSVPFKFINFFTDFVNNNNKLQSNCDFGSSVLGLRELLHVILG